MRSQGGFAPASGDENVSCYPAHSRQICLQLLAEPTVLSTHKICRKPILRQLGGLEECLAGLVPGIVLLDMD